MEKKEPPKRDNKGDIKFNHEKYDWDEIRKSQYTYVFNYYDEKKDHYFPYFGLFSTTDEHLEKAKDSPDFYEIELYKTPEESPFDFFIKYHNSQLGMLVEFFKEVFEERAFLDGYQPNNKYSRIILPKAKHDEIINCINEFGLLQIRDLLFEVISIGQHNYVTHISFWETAEMQKLVTTAKEETQKAIDVIEKIDQKELQWDAEEIKSRSELLHINFAFNDGTIKIKHAWLAKEFIDHFKKYYNDLHYKNWRFDLERYPDRFEDNIKKQQFKYKLAKSLYNLLTRTGLFKVSKKEPTPNRLMHCIACLLKFCLIDVADTDELDEIKVKKVRNWIKRKELKPALTFAEIPADKERLLKYFEPEFINITEDIKRVDAISVAYFLGKRFNIENLIPDLAHIAQALKEISFFIGHQMLDAGRPFKASFEEFTSFSRLINVVRNNKKITSIKYKLEGDDKEYELEQRLPMYLIEEALKEYSEDNQVEFDTDPVRTTVTKTEDGTFKVDKENKFNIPEERFMVRFVKSFYDYLLAEAPPANERDFMPSKRYYEIIGNILQLTSSFYHQRNPEWFIIAKVRQWHELALMAKK